MNVLTEEKIKQFEQDIKDGKGAEDPEWQNLYLWLFH